GGAEVPVPVDPAGRDAVLLADVGGHVHQRVPQCAGGSDQGVRALVLDPDRGGVGARGVHPLREGGAALQPGQALIPALHDVTASADGELLAGVGPAVVVHVPVLDGPGQLERPRLGVVGDVPGGGVVNDDLVRPVVEDRDGAPGGAGAPGAPTVDGGGGHRGLRRGGGAEGGPGQRPAAEGGGTDTEQHRAPQHRAAGDGGRSLLAFRIEFRRVHGGF